MDMAEHGLTCASERGRFSRRRRGYADKTAVADELLRNMASRIVRLAQGTGMLLTGWPAPTITLKLVSSRLASPNFTAHPARRPH